MNTKSKIHYIDLKPGVGKTHWAINRMVDHLVKSPCEADGVIVYVAPTIALLKEVLEKIKAEGVLLNNVYTITSTSGSAVKETIRSVFEGYDTYLRVKQEFLRANKPIDTKEFEDTVLLQCFKENRNSKINDGGIVLMTHEAFWMSDFAGDRPTFLHQDKIEVIMDETRQCFLGNIDIHITKEGLYDKCLQYFDIQPETTFTEVSQSLIDPDSLYARLPELYNELSKKEREKLKEFVTRYGANIYIKVKAYATEKQKDSFCIDFVQIPYAGLVGWKNLTIIASFYRDSQLYHIIEASKSIGNMRYAFEQVNISDQINAKERIKWLRTRYKSTDITYVFTNRVSLSNYKNGLVAYNQHHKTGSFLDKVESTIMALASFKGTEHDKWATFQSLKSIGSLFAESEIVEPPESDGALDQTLVSMKFTFKHDSLDADLTKLIKNIGSFLAPISPIEYAATVATNIAVCWRQQHPYYVETESSQSVCPSIALNSKFLLNINAKNFMDDLSDPESLWDRWIPKPVQARCDKLIGDMRGLNRYSNYNVVLFLSAVRPYPALVEWFEEFCPSYDPDVDITLGYCIQTIMRCAIRNIQSTQNVLLVLPDRYLAQQVYLRFDGLPKFMEPIDLGANESILITAKDLIVDKVMETEDAKTKMQKYRKTDRYKKMYARYKTKPKTLCRNAYLKEAIPEEYSSSARITAYRKRKELLTKYGDRPEVATAIKEYDDFIDRCKYYSSRATHQFAALWARDSSSLIDKYVKPKQKALLQETSEASEPLSFKTTASFKKAVLAKGFSKDTLFSYYYVKKTIKTLQSDISDIRGVLRLPYMRNFPIEHATQISEYLTSLECKANVLRLQVQAFDDARDSFIKRVMSQTKKESETAVLEKVKPNITEFFPKVGSVRKTLEVKEAFKALLKHCVTYDGECVYLSALEKYAK